MQSLINDQRPPVFCPGCAHDRVVHALDKALQQIGAPANRVAIVSDIGCSGLFDTFFNTHAFHGLHGRALTYATGLKMARPDLHVIVTMGDGGMGIGGAHLLAACRRNLNLTLLVLNNFNFGMTGGQFSATTPPDASVASGFLNGLEKPLDICQVASSAGATYVARRSTYAEGLDAKIAEAIAFDGFAIMDLQGVCPGRYTRKNRLTPAVIDAQIAALPAFDGPVPENARGEYAAAYRQAVTEMRPAAPPAKVTAEFTPPATRRQEIMILGGAGQRIVTAGELLCLAGLAAGLNATQKNDYPITVLRGHSVSELILDPEPIGYTGIQRPDAVIALAPEGVARRRAAFAGLHAGCVVVRAADVEIPETGATVIDVDFRERKIKGPERALAALAVLAKSGHGPSPEMLDAAMAHRFSGKVLDASRALVKTVFEWD